VLSELCRQIQSGDALQIDWVVTAAPLKKLNVQPNS
jgi:hypothetical protein